MVEVDTVLVAEVVNTVGFVTEEVTPVDFNVGVTVADGFVKAAGLLSLSTRGLMGTVIGVADVPALLGKGSGLDEASSAAFDCTCPGKNCLLDGTGDKLEFCLIAGNWGVVILPGVPALIGDSEELNGVTAAGCISLGTEDVWKLLSDKGSTGLVLFVEFVDEAISGELFVTGKAGADVTGGMKPEPAELGVLAAGDEAAAVSAGSNVFSNLLESSSKTDFFDKSC